MSLIERSTSGMVEMAQRVKVLATKLEDLGSIPRAHMVEKKK